MQSQSKTFVFGDLPPDEKAKFMEFMISNNVEFTQDPNDGMYVATIRIVNQIQPSQQETVHAYEESKESIEFE